MADSVLYENLRNLEIVAAIVVKAWEHCSLLDGLSKTV